MYIYKILNDFILLLLFYVLFNVIMRIIQFLALLAVISKRYVEINTVARKLQLEINTYCRFFSICAYYSE